MSSFDELILRRRGIRVHDTERKVRIHHESPRAHEYTGKRFLSFHVPDGLPIELHEEFMHNC